MHSTVILVRSAETEWFATGRLLGRRDVALSEAGHARAARLAERFARLDVAEVVCSPLVRAVETADAIAAPHKIEVARDPRLTELHCGIWEGTPLKELAALAEYREFLASPSQRTPPGGESLVALRDRMQASLSQALEDNQAGARIVLVSHDTALRVILAALLGIGIDGFQRIELAPGGYAVLRFDSDREPPRIVALHGDDTP